VNRDTTDYTFNVGLDPTIRIGTNAITFNSGIQEIVRRDSESPVQLNQNLFRVFTYASTTAFFNAISVSGYVIRESGPFTESNQSSSQLTGAIDFRVGSPWGKTALVTGWGSNKQTFSPVNYQNYYTSSYVGLDRKFGQRLDVRAMVEDLRAWRVATVITGTGTAQTSTSVSGIAQDLRPAGWVDFTPHRNWDIQVSSAYSSTRSFHVYDNIQNGFSVSYATPFHRKITGEGDPLTVAYPIRFSGGVQDDSFFNFGGNRSQQLRPYFGITIF
jgi:hypothetical protein